MSSTNLQQLEETLHRGEYQRAVDKATELLEKYPRDAKLLMARSTAYLRLGDAERSLKDAEASVVTSSGQVRSDAQLRRAFALKRLGRNEHAAAALKFAAGSSEPSRFTLLSQQLTKYQPCDLEEIPGRPQVAAQTSEPQGAVTRAIRRDWYQSTARINLDVYIRDHHDKDAEVRIGQQSISIKAKDVEFELYLAHPITQTSSYTVSPYKFSFVLEKQEPGQWRTLEGVPGQPDAPLTTAPTPTPYKSAFEKSWDIQDSDDETSNDPNDFFSEIYRNADPDSKRAMMKSFVESKGTTLSTNWDEVKSGVVEPHPPKDMNIN